MATSLAFPEDTTRIDFGEMAVPDDSTSSSTTGVAGQQQAKKKSLMVPSVAAAAAMAAWAASRSTFIKVAGYNTRSCASAVCFHSSVLARDTNYPLAATTQLHYPSRLLPFDQSHHLNRHKHHLLQLKPPQLSLLKTPVLVLQLLLLRQTPTTTHTTAGTLFVARRAVPFLVGYEIARRGLLPQQPIRH